MKNAERRERFSARNPYLRVRTIEDMMDKMLNIKGNLVSLDTPVVMGILNVTPDSFYAASRQWGEADIERRIETILSEGGAWIDVGGYSSRPDAEDVSPEDEKRRLEPALRLLRDRYPEVPVSLDTFRAEVARWGVEEYGVALINDISGGELDEAMFRTVAGLRVPYLLMHMRGTPRTMQRHTDYADLMEEVMLYFARKVRELRLLGVNDIILDPGFGFSKALEQNYRLLHDLDRFREIRFPGTCASPRILVGVSRKSMIYRLAGITPEESLAQTQVLHLAALERGADILRVHDVAEAVRTVRTFRMLCPDEI